MSPHVPREVTQRPLDWSRGDQTALGRLIPAVLQRHAEHVVARFEGGGGNYCHSAGKMEGPAGAGSAGALEAKTAGQNDLRQVVGRIADMYAIWGAADKAAQWRKQLGPSKD